MDLKRFSFYISTGMYVTIFLADLIVFENFHFEGCLNDHIYVMKFEVFRRCTENSECTADLRILALLL